MPIGFTRHTETAKNEIISPDRAFLRFDSGRGLSFDDAAYHLAVLGTTGSGKTMTVILPAIDTHLKAGHAGLILDIKGNLSGQVRALAARCGREADIVEIGTAPTCPPRNMIAGMGASAFHDFCLGLVSGSFNGQSHNMDFHVRGVGMGTDCYSLLSWLAEDDPAFAPSMPLIMEMMSTPQLSTQLFEAWSRKETTLEQKSFCERVKSDQFHVLSQLKAKIGNFVSSSHREQMAFNTRAFVSAFEAAVNAPGVAGRLFASNAPGIGMKRMIDENKIIILRFTPETGSVGGRLARAIIGMFYESIISRGVANAKPTFVIMDEFQEVADLSAARNSDASFISLAREFKCGVVVATQSLSSLASNDKFCGVDKFLSNCNAKLFFFSDDPATRTMASRYMDTDLIDLRAGSMLAARYDSAAREHRWGIETMLEAYQDVAALAPIPSQRVEESPRNPMLVELVQRRLTPAGAVRPAAQLAPGQRAPGQIVDAASRVTPARPVIDTPPPFQAKRQDGDSMKPECVKLIQEFPGLFTSDAHVIIPSGWMEHVAGSLRLVQTTNLDVVIAEIRMTGSHLYAIDSGGDGDGIKILNRLLKSTKKLCLACGKPVSDAEDDDDEDEIDFWDTRNNSSMPFCEVCMKKCGVKAVARPEEKKDMK